MRLMNMIYRDELKARLDRGDPVKVVMTLSDWAYRAKRIPGSLHFATLEEAAQALDPTEEIIVYCAGYDCMASVTATDYLESQGFTHVRRYAGGVADWEEAGYPLEGDMVA